jgi:conflict system pore-forming effector with SLATT domain
MADQGLREEDLPGLFDAADTASLSGQRQYVRTVRLRLVLTVVVAATGIVSWRVGARGVDLAAIGTAIALAAITITELNLRASRPEDRWYDGRALAESAKSLAWRYSVGGIPFAGQADEPATRQRFIDELARLLQEAPTTSVKPSQRPVISEAMARLRAGDLATRKAAYLEFRIDNQQEWYAKNATYNEQRANLWRTVLLTIEVLGLAAALARAAGFVNLDLAGVSGAVIAAGTAWMNLRQHTTLARAYTFAANELAIAHSRLELVAAEDAWAAEVADSEEAVSREHTMWRASRSRPSS